MSREITYTDNFVLSAADKILYTMRRVLAKQDFFCLSLSGGTTPLPVYTQMARDGKDIPWDRVIITFGDERCVPPDHEQSNYRAAQISFLNLVPIPLENILRIMGEISPASAADNYEEQLDKTAARLKAKSFIHDLVLLGMGDDGHTASLFPGTEALNVTERRVVANYVPKLHTHRITLTFPFINQSKQVIILVNDSKKRGIIENILSGKGEYPVAKIRPERGNLIWILGGLL